MAQKILTGIVIWMMATMSQAQENPDFRTLDNRLLGLYEQAQWDSLKIEGIEALGMGIDYYYLRMRLGIAWFETGNYLKAIPHFSRALEFNPYDPAASEYLYLCYYYLNNTISAVKALSGCPPSVQKKLSYTYPSNPGSVGIEAGLILSNQDRIFPGRDPDGQENLYGEADILDDGISSHAGSSFNLTPVVKMRLMYSYVMLNKTMIVAEDNRIRLSYPYRVDQHQVYLGTTIALPNGFLLYPAFHFIKTGLDEWDYFTGDDGSVYLKFSRGTINSWIGFMALSRDFGIIHPMIFGGLSGLGEARQYQGGFRATVLPFGNLDFYLTSTLTGHHDAGDLQLIFDQLIGFRVARPLWLEISASAGKRTNYFGEFASLVHNIPDQIRFMETTKFILLISPAFRLTFNYDYLIRADDMVYYESNFGNSGWSSVARHRSATYHSQFISGGILWKF